MKVSRYGRPERPPRMVFTQRDGQILEWLFQARALRRDHIQSLLFIPGAGSRCQRRLTLLYQNRYIDKLPGQPANAPDVYFISRKNTGAVKYLQQFHDPADLIARIGKPGKVEHTLGVNECRVRFQLAASAAGWELNEWYDDIDLAELGRSAGIVPDAYFRIRRPVENDSKTAAFFLEVEHTKRSRGALRAKFRAYVDFYRGGGYEARFGTRALRVLFVLATEDTANPWKRLEALVSEAARLEATMFRFTTFEGLMGQAPDSLLFAPLWRRPGDNESCALFSE